jgi:hypothetical protein
VIIEFTKSFDRLYAKLPEALQDETDETISSFLDYYASRQFPKSLRVHKCGRFLSLSITMNYRVFVLPIPGGVKFVFVGNHRDAEEYLKK